MDGELPIDLYLFTSRLSLLRDGVLIFKFDGMSTLPLLTWRGFEMLL